MITLLRWAKFNLIGAMGMVLQLGFLAVFNGWMGGHYLYASAAAVELTLLHNFVWHVHCTWSGSRSRAARRRQCVKFHLSNGLVSMAGNLLLMRFLIHAAHLPLLVSNLIAIVCCSTANFALGDKWVFATPHRAAAAGVSNRRVLIPVVTAALSLSAMAAALR